MGIAQESIAVLVFGNFGDTPKTLVFSRFLAFARLLRQLRRSSEGAGASRRLSGWCGYDWRDSLYLG